MKKQIDKNIIKFKTNNYKQYKIKPIINSAIFVKKVKNKLFAKILLSSFLKKLL